MNKMNLIEQLAKDIAGDLRYTGNDTSTISNIADEIETSICSIPKHLGLPLDADGVPCGLDDIVWHNGKKMKVVAMSHKGSLSVRDFSRNDGKGAIWVKAKYVTHKEPDTCLNEDDN